MGTDIVAIERQLDLAAPHFAEVLQGTPLSVDRLKRTIVISLTNLPALMDCSPQSIMNAAMTAACLGLEVDGVTGQAYLIPFAGKCQLIIGYKGFNTLAARSGYTIRAAVVREGDEFIYSPSEGTCQHLPVLGSKGRIIAAWARAVSKVRPPVADALGIDDLMAVKAKSPGASKRDSPWNDPLVGFPAMCEKTARRRLARSMPLNVMQYGAAIDEAVEERGLGAYMAPDTGIVIEGAHSPIAVRDESEQGKQKTIEAPSFDIIGADGETYPKGSIEEWESAIRFGLDRTSTAEKLAAFEGRMAPVFIKLLTTGNVNADAVKRVLAECDRLKGAFGAGGAP